MNKIVWVLLLAGISLPGCLTTRAQLREEETKKVQVTPAQERKAHEVARLDEFDDEIRAIRGRIEVVENQVAHVSDGQSDRQGAEKRNRAEIESRFQSYEEALKKLETQVSMLDAEVKSLKAKPREAPAPVAPTNAKDAFKMAEEAFAKKDWKQAIVEYENYRKIGLKAKYYGLATYKIGASFHELNMRDEAKAFYEEVVAKFPSSKEAKKASQKLKAMK